MYDVDEIAELGRSLVATDAGALSEDDRVTAVLELASLQAMVQVAQARLLAGLEHDEVCIRRFGMTTGAWLAREAMLPAGAARAQVSTAVRLVAHFPKVLDAVGTRSLSFEHAKYVVGAANPRVRDQFASLQDDIITLAQSTGFDRWKHEVRGIADLLDEDGGHDPDDGLARNRLQVSEGLDGGLHLHGEAVGEHALGLAQLIDAKADELFRRYRADKEHAPELEVPTRTTLRMLALCELVRQGSATPVETSTPPRPEVMLVINTDEPSAVYDAHGRRLPPDTTKTLLCDSDFYAMVVDKLGVPFDMGRKVRFATNDQRKALAALYGGCAFPGCGCPPHWCDAHHADDYVAKKGHTNFSRLVPLCRRHHGITHRRGWQMHIDPDGWVWWQTPTGDAFWSQRHQRLRQLPPPTPISVAKAA